MSALLGVFLFFVVAALLFLRTRNGEGFVNPPSASTVPADLNLAPPTAFSPERRGLPMGTTRPIGIPGSSVATGGTHALASRKDLQALDQRISIWLDGAEQREHENPGSLTPEQLSRRVMLQGRLADIRTQYATGHVTDSAKALTSEASDLRRENAGWQQMSPSVDPEAIHGFAKESAPDAFLTPEQYARFRGIFNAGVKQLQDQPQPDPLQRVRLQQLQVLRQDVASAEKARGTQGPPHIRVSSARLFLTQMLKPDQPLPSILNAMGTGMGTGPNGVPAGKGHAANPADVLGDLQNIQWRLTASSVDPADQALKASITRLLDRLQSGGATHAEVESARATAADIRNGSGPVAFGYGSGSGSGQWAPVPSRSPFVLNDRISTEVKGYDPSNWSVRANTLCNQVREAFPQDAEALGCPKQSRSGSGFGSKNHTNDQSEGENIVRLVCERIRYSVPSVSPEQFNCPNPKN